MEKNFYDRDILIRIKYYPLNALELLNIKRDILEIFNENCLNYEEDIELVVDAEDFEEDYYPEIIDLTEENESTVLYIEDECSDDFLEDEFIDEDVMSELFSEDEFHYVGDCFYEGEDLEEFRIALEDDIIQNENLEEQQFFDVIGFMNSIKNYYDILQLEDDNSYDESFLFKKLYMINNKCVLIDKYRGYEIVSAEELESDYISLKDFIKNSKVINAYAYVSSNEFFDMNVIDCYNPVKILFQNKYGLLVKNIDEEYMFLDQRYNKCDWVYIDNITYTKDEEVENINSNDDVEDMDEYKQLMKIYKSVDKSFPKK